MRLDVPFYPQTSNPDCGPYALKMVLAYFGKDLPIEIIKEKTRIKEGKGVYTIQLAIAAASLGTNVKFLSTSLSLNKVNMKLDFYKKYAEVFSDENFGHLLVEAKTAGVTMEQKSVELKELLSYATENSLPIVLVDWNVIINEKNKGYAGHFVPVVGHDSKNIYVHNQGSKTPTAFLPIKKEMFDKARKSFGTDEDIVVVYR